MAPKKLNNYQSEEVLARRLRFGTVTGTETETSQAFKDECDINRVLDRAKKGVGMAHLANYQKLYGDFQDFDGKTFEDMQIKLAEANTIFQDLPAHIRNEFDNQPGKFFEFVNNDENKDRLEEIFPVLANPHMDFPDVIGGLAKSIETLAAASSDAPTGTDASKGEVEGE
ncbi:internal scaffolding protein [Microviridae sp.]|nr:internal scaffolding protein [Microviridae sp.]